MSDDGESPNLAEQKQKRHASAKAKKEAVAAKSKADDKRVRDRKGKTVPPTLDEKTESCMTKYFGHMDEQDRANIVNKKNIWALSIPPSLQHLKSTIHPPHFQNSI